MEETGVPGGNHRPTASNWWKIERDGIDELPREGWRQWHQWANGSTGSSTRSGAANREKEVIEEIKGHTSPPELYTMCFTSNSTRCRPTAQGDEDVAEDEGNNPEDADNNTKDAANTGVKTGDVDLPRIENWTSELVGQYRVTEYEGRPYAGIILEVGEIDVQISCMVAIGKNRFFWPRREDVCWYEFDKVICIIPEPQNVTGRHKEVDPLIWAMLQRKMSLDGWLPWFINIFYLSIALQNIGSGNVELLPYRTINEIETVRPACSFISLSIVLYLTW